MVLTTANFGGFSNFCRYYTRSQTGKSTGYRPTLKPLLPPTYLSIVHTQRDGKSVRDVFLYSNFTFECIKKKYLHLKHVFCCSRNLDVYLNQSGSYTPKIIKFKDWIWKLSNHFNNTVQSNTWFFFNILWHPTKIYGPKVFLLSKIKPEYSDILYNPTHFLGPLVCPIRQVPM